MNNAQKGIALSIIIHGMVMSAFLFLWMDKLPIQSRAITLDFAILNFQEHGDRPGLPTGERHGGSGPEITKQVSPEWPIKGHGIEKAGPTSLVTESSALNASISRGVAGTTSDKDGTVGVAGKEGTSTGEGEKETGRSSSGMLGHASAGEGYGGGDGRTIRYGTGSSYEKAFRYIREGIMKNVKYPEIARRKGMAGKILLSFTVSEGGLPSDIKVINSSGFTELDNSAKNAVARTTFSQKIPYRLFVILPIEYRLE